MVILKVEHNNKGFSNEKCTYPYTIPINILIPIFWVFPRNITIALYYYIGYPIWLCATWVCMRIEQYEVPCVYVAIQTMYIVSAEQFSRRIAGAIEVVINKICCINFRCYQTSLTVWEDEGSSKFTNLSLNLLLPILHFCVV